ncbi:MAG: glycogen/starch/alpha-glucan phosphorylase [Clostridiales bacterium]|nr:glycogen/starch/alpha-glucan phosphorylase [Clostridiales bacterium]
MAQTKTTTKKAANKLTAQEEALKKEIIGKVSRHFGKVIEDATPQMIYTACALTARDQIMAKWTVSHKEVKKEHSKKLYYLSFEFLMGRMLTTNILNLMQTKTYENVLRSLGYEINEVAELENDMGLGNGGLGRLAACFIDSLTTLDLPAYGSSIRYQYGLFKQKIIDGYQIELPDPWLEHGNAWEIARPEETVEVKFGGYVSTQWQDGNMICKTEGAQTILAVPYDIPLCGYDSKIVNKLRVWSAKATDTNVSGKIEKIVEERLLAENISNILYPDDTSTEGKELRLKQQYFLSSATLQWIFKEFEKAYGNNYAMMPEKIVIHINDTHPTLAIPEMMRILMDEKGLGWDAAWEIVTHTFAYTNHTVLSEALERWPIDMFRKILPRIYMIVEEINRRLMIGLEEFYPGDHAKHKWMAVLADNQVYMANLCLASCFAVNGVSQLHTQILKDDIFADYYRMNKDRFFAITNGITFRRWIANCNPALTELINSKIGTSWLKNADELAGIAKYADDKDFQAAFAKIKHDNKIRLAEYIKENNGIEVNPDSIFDVQSKRLHEYKRQMMNVLHILAEYNRCLEDKEYLDNYYPKTYLFGAKAAPGYTRAKLIIKLINSVGTMINNDGRINGKIKVVFLENYSVSIAEKLIVAADVSEQISTAGKEASGTGNMKFMLNGAVTCGTLDGANVEMLDQVGSDNIYIFGLKADEVAARLRYPGDDEVKDIYSTNTQLRRALEQLVDGSIVPGANNLFKDLYQTLLFGDYGYPDTYMVLRDFEEYMRTQEKISADYQDKEKWLHMAIMNTAMAGFFSSDRTIREYSDKIWHLTPIK